ncbi:Na+/H+ antiporter NhaA [Flavobacterium humi]|uniref:Na(+)/H(+) antiporter NhaA n=1 Tax=Flavobacterium humi TaxID=2562683 RepID=A0A4Z0LDF2_9FLAO|nr:Na+/H+ antiporter NhaA [Flavobacterium humi]TGD59901.1 Na+/H+ antiporter NhaA [Flavobacterium humi]
MAKLINTKIWKEFSESGTLGGILLFLCLILSLIIANTSLGESFNDFLSTEIGFHSEKLHLNYSISLWINDGLMAVFFLLVGLEIKRELVEGELSSPKNALLPILCAIGGAIIPAVIYYVLNYGKPTSAGWGIPMATDIAFALAVITMLGKRVPASLKIFLAALAIVDDLLAILVIVIFYSSKLDFTYLMYAGVVFLLLLVFNRMKIKNIYFYIIPGIFIWYFIHNSGIHATIAGVLTAFALPTTADDVESPLEKLEHILVKPVNFIIIPIFALANTNIHMESSMVQGLFSSLGLGILLGLLLGKPIGILLVSWLSVKLKICELPQDATWTHILGVGLLGGIGFTMSIFISLLSFSNPVLISEAKFSILIASVLSGILGYTLLKINYKKAKN